MVPEQSPQLPSIIFDGIIDKYLQAYIDPSKRQLAQKDIHVYLSGSKNKDIVPLYNAISRVRFGPSHMKDITISTVKNAITDIIKYDTYGRLWQHTVNFYKLHHFIGDEILIEYMDRHHMRISLDAYMCWMRAIYLNGVYFLDRKITVSPLSHKALYILKSKRIDDALHVAKTHKSYFLESLLYGGGLSKEEYDKIFGNIVSMPSSLSYAGALLRICGWVLRYDVIESAIMEAKKRFTARPKDIAHYYAPVYKSLSDMMYIRAQSIRIQRAWRDYAEKTFRRKLVMTLCKANADPKLAYIVCTHLSTKPIY